MPDVDEKQVEAFLLNNPTFSRNFFSRHGPELKVDCGRSITNVQSSSFVTAGNHESIRSAYRESLYPMGVRASSAGSCTDSFQDEPEQKTSKVLLTMDKERAKVLRQTRGEDELFVELIKDIANELNVDELCFKILYNVNLLTNSDRGSLFLACDKGGKKTLESHIFDVREGSSLESSIVPQNNKISIPFGKGIVGHAAQTKEYINIKNAYEDSRFNKEVDVTTGYHTHSILAMPILNRDNEVLGVAMVMNKNNESEDFSDHVFTQQDVQVFQSYAAFCGIGLHNAQLFEMSEMNHKTNQLLLVLAKEIFTEQTSVDKLVDRIVSAAQDSGLLAVEYCLVYLLKTTQVLSPSSKDPSFEKVFVLNNSSCSQEPNVTSVSFSTLPYKKAAHLAAQAVISGKTRKLQFSVDEDQNLLDIRELEEIKDQYEIKTTLTIPMRNNEGTLVGVLQLVNKKNHCNFTMQDCGLFETLAIFIGLGVHNANMYETASKLAAKQAVALEVLSYHATAQTEETERLVHAKIPTAAYFNIYSFDFNDFKLDDDDTLKATIRMFIDSGITKTFQVNYSRIQGDSHVQRVSTESSGLSTEIFPSTGTPLADVVLCRWVCSVKKNYRPVIYHNWRHAFNVAQMMFSILYTGEYESYFSKLEVFALLVGCLCHDLDHRGTNNAFQSKSDSPLSLLYGTSTLEHHHFDHCIMILNSEGNNIFGELPSNEYRNCINMVESAILSTDLALYFKKRALFKELVDNGEEDFLEDYKRELLRSMLMTACDVSGTAKPWDVQIEVAKRVTSEFFEQGDMEKKKFATTPVAMFDRDKKDELPKLQIGFIESISLPLYEMLTQVKTAVGPVYETAKENKVHWTEVADIVQSMPDPQPKNGQHLGSESAQQKKISIVLQKQMDLFREQQEQEKQQQAESSCSNTQNDAGLTSISGSAPSIEDLQKHVEQIDKANDRKTSSKNGRHSNSPMKPKATGNSSRRSLPQHKDDGPGEDVKGKESDSKFCVLS